MIPPFATATLLAHFRQIADQRPPDVVIGGADNPYLRRWHLTPRGDDPALYLHHFLRSDDDRALHDHPWASVSIILAGSYLEHTHGDIIVRDPQSAHRVQLHTDTATGSEIPCWTLFAVGPRVREWGFHCPRGWVHWRDFTAGANGELVGKGCEP